jgi:hypothetical protein
MEAVVAYLKVLKQHISRESEIMESLSWDIRLLGRESNLYLLNMNQEW